MFFCSTRLSNPATRKFDRFTTTTTATTTTTTLVNITNGTVLNMLGAF